MRRRTLLMALPLTAVLASCGVASRAGKGSSAGASAGASGGGFEVTDVVGRKVTFSITARDEKEVIGTATHERFIVAKEKFEAKAQSKKS